MPKGGKDFDMTGKQALVTIGVPVYNGAAMLRDMLDSLAGQTFERFRVVICDNASTDATPAIAQEFVERDARFVYHRNPENIGAAPNFNRVWELDHSTPYYKWAAHDDIYAPTYLERCVAVLDADPDVVVAYPITVMVDDTREGEAVDAMLLADVVLDEFIDAAGRPAWTIGPLHLASSEDPAARLDDCLNRMAGSFEIFGVMRTAAVEQTQLHASYYGSDRALLSQLVCLGRFEQVPERLYFNRFHKAASRLMTRDQQRTWIDAKGGSRMFIMRMHVDILAAPFRARLGPLDCARCIGLTAQHLLRMQAGRIRRKLQRLTGLGPHRGGVDDDGKDDVSRRAAV